MKLLWLKSLKSGQIAVNKKFYEKLLQPQILPLHFGMLRVKLEVIIKNDLSDETIGLSMELSNGYTIPKDIPYEIYYNDGEIYLGPVIAYVTTTEFKDLRRKKYIKSLPLFLDYNSIKGLIVICTGKSISLSSETIEGYYFNPNGSKPRDQWQYGKFPLPDAMFNHSLMGQKRISAIQNKIGDRFFNSYRLNLDKWKSYELLSKNPILKQYLPHTEEFKDTAQLNRLLDQYSSIYLKPSYKARGRGLMKLDKEMTGISLIDYNRVKYSLKDYKNLAQFFENKLPIPYIVQQAVHYKANNQHVDFRLILQKNEIKEWSLTGLVARIALKGSIITNNRGRAKSMPGREALTTIFDLNEEAAEKIEAEMVQLTKDVVKMYEEKGLHLGDVAADLALDSNLKVWLLELQLNYGVNARTTEGLQEFFKKVVSSPFKYAKALAGFTEKN